MFYSHEVLTSRKYGVATVWLVATLGAKSNLKKVTRKAIREVNVPKACRTIIDPAAPMALRLQGNLLYGVSRVYFEQCNYVLSDAQNAHNAMRTMLDVVKKAALDPEAGKAKPELLMLQDDPSFLPDFALPPLDLLAQLSIDLLPEIPRHGESQSLTPYGTQQEHATPAPPGGGLNLPSSSSPQGGELRIHGDDGTGTVGAPSDILGEGGPEFLEEPDFGFDADGNFIDFAENVPIASSPAMALGSAMPGDARASSRVGGEHGEGQGAEVEQFRDQMDLNLPILGDDLPEGDAFPPAAEQQSEKTNGLSDPPDTSSTAEAPTRRKTRAPRVLPIDTGNAKISSKEIGEWSRNYLQNMKEAGRLKAERKAIAEAKKRAEYYVWGHGIGGLGRLLSKSTAPHPLDRYWGDNLFELYTGVDRRAVAKKKRDRDSGIDEEMQEDARNVRPRLDTDDEHVGRAEDDEGMFMPGDDEDVELPREAPSALDDKQVFSAMPWNISASNRGSSAVPRSGMLGSVGGPSTGAQGSLRQRGSRFISASPLHGRGQPGGLEALRDLTGDDEFGSVGLDDFGLPPQPSDDSVYMEPEDVAQPSVRVRDALDAEGENFLAFVSDAIAEKRAQAEIAADADEVLFEELLPPAENTRMVACQGLMMVLALSTKGLLDVRQEEAFEEIGLSLSKKARTMQIAAAEAAAEAEAKAEGGAEGEKAEEEEEGEFEEQMTAGIGAGSGGAADDDDDDSLYD